MASIKGWKLKNVKTWEAWEGEGVQADIYYQNKLVGRYSDWGQGGEPEIDLRGDEKLQAQLQADTKSYYTAHPDPLYVEHGIEPDVTAFFPQILVYSDKEKLYKKSLKNGKPILVIKNEAFELRYWSLQSIDSIPLVLQRNRLQREEVEVYTCLEDFDIQ